MNDSTTNDSSRIVQCSVTGRPGAGLDRQPHSGELGERIFKNVSSAGWQQWLQYLAMIINENGINTSEPAVMPFIEDHMHGFFFDEGPYAGANRFRPPNPIENTTDLEE